MVSSEVKNIIPDVLIDYLWTLVLGEDWQTDQRQLLILEAGKLSGRDVQDIYHLHDTDSFTDTRRVYGIEPTSCKIQVLNSQNSYQMSLC